jgi:hypothetical protein
MATGQNHFFSKSLTSSHNRVPTSYAYLCRYNHHGVLWAVTFLGQFSDSGDKKGPCDNFKGFFPGKNGLLSPHYEEKNIEVPIFRQ